MRIRVLVALTLSAQIASGQTRVNPMSCEAVVSPSDSGTGRFGDVAEGRNGRLAWTDGRPGQFLVRDGEGKVRVVGRTGAGPGEFDRPVLLVWRADTILASDLRLRRVQAFSDTGRLLRTMTALMPAVWASQPDGRLVAIRPVALADESSLPFVLVSQRPGELSIDTIAQFANPAVERFERTVGLQRVRNHQPFQATAFAVGTTDGARFCGIAPAGDATQLRCTDGMGREVINRRLSLAPRQLSDAIYDSTIKIHLGGGNSAADMRARIKRPRTLPPVLGIMMTESGEVWLQRSHRFESNAIWARLRRDGSVRDEVVIDKRYRIVKPDAEFVWAATADADGLETLLNCHIAG